MVPDSSSDVATFATSSQRQIAVSAITEIGGINFSRRGDSFTISSEPGDPLTLGGSGIVNNSGKLQTFLCEISGGRAGGFTFSNSATAGQMASFGGSNGSVFVFFDASSAGSATFDVSSSGAYQSDMFFWDSSTAADATITASNSVVNFLGTSTAANAHITVSADSFFSLTEQAHGGNAVVTCIGGNQYAGSSIYFQEYATAEGGTYTAIGGSTSGEFGSFIDFTDSATADNATFVVNGGMGAGLAGASLTFDDTTTAAQANITANGGVGGSEGGAIFFDKKSKGSNAGVTLNGNGELDISHHRGSGISIGSLTGEGSVFLGDNTLTIGGNNRSTAFSGIIQGTGGVAKSGTGTLTVSGANIYTGPTTVKGGVFVANNKQGSATGTGSVNVQTGTLAGKGAVSGPVTIGTGSGSGAFLAPSVAAPQPVTLSLASTLTLQADGTYTCKLNTSKARSDEVVANGVTIATGAHFGLQPMTNKKLAAGTVFTIVSNTASTPISGTFANLADGAVLTVGNTKLQASYEGGDGNDLALTVVP